jgi:hypothetical protein
MFKNSLKIGPIRGAAGNRRERRIKPSLEHLDGRIAPSGASAVAPLIDHPTPNGSPTPHQFAAVALQAEVSSPSWVLKGGHPQRSEPWQFSPDPGGGPSR